MTANPYPFDFDFLEEISTRITNEVDGVCRVVYDLTRYAIPNADRNSQLQAGIPFVMKR